MSGCWGPATPRSAPQFPSTRPFPPSTVHPAAPPALRPLRPQILSTCGSVQVSGRLAAAAPRPSPAPAKASGAGPGARGAVAGAALLTCSRPSSAQSASSAGSGRRRRARGAMARRGGLGGPLCGLCCPGGAAAPGLTVGPPRRRRAPPRPAPPTPGPAPPTPGPAPPRAPVPARPPARWGPNEAGGVRFPRLVGGGGDGEGAGR